MRKRFAELTVREQERVSERLILAEFELPQEDEGGSSAGTATQNGVPLFLPGNFLMLRCEPAEPYRLMRPMSVLGFDENSHSIQILYRVVGDQTHKLSLALPGMKLPAVYPLGNHFELPHDPAIPLVMVAGGVGLPPLLFLASSLGAKGLGAPRVYYGARDKSLLAPQFLERLKGDFRLATEDGSVGFKGTVVELLESEGLPTDAWVYACGPRPMLGALKRLLASSLAARCQSSLEEIMACGTGACYGCAVRSKESGVDANKLVCRDGPVFELEQVSLD
jgi:dihydroorotate dehydrogenase electron transfer subunit